MCSAVASGKCWGRFVDIVVAVIAVHVGNGKVHIEVFEGASGGNLLECVAGDECGGAWSGVGWYGVVEGQA